MSKVADNWHKEWYRKLLFQEGLCKMEHTEGKWEAKSKTKNSPNCVAAIWTDAAGRRNTWFVCEVFGNPEHSAEANAHRICLCVNGWDELEKQRDALLALLKRLEHRLKMGYQATPFNEKAILEELEQAIAEAEK